MSSVLIIGGPTAAGKTALAVELAKKADAIVVSADAMQVYRGMDIGTAKVTTEEMQGVPHLGIDVVDPHESFHAASFVELVDQALQKFPRVILAGGTTLYLRAAIRGLVKTPPPPEGFREWLEGLDDLHERLAVVDPALAARLHPNDRIRLVRGLEVFEATGTTLSSLQAAHAAAPDRIASVGIWVDRDDLDERIDRRVELMMEAGYLDEVKGLLSQGVSSECKPMRSLGYRHLTEHLQGTLALDEAVRRTQRDSRRFARKQRTWRKQLDVTDIDPRAPGSLDWALQQAFGTELR